MVALDDQFIVRRAVKLVAVGKVKSEAFAADVQSCLDEMAVMSAISLAVRSRRSKQAKIAATTLSVALHRVVAARKNTNLDITVRAFFDQDLPPEKISKWIHRCRDLSMTKSGKPARNAETKVSAASEALYLLRKYSIDVVTTKKSVYCQLAALLHGTPGADLQHQCRAVLQKRKTG